MKKKAPKDSSNSHHPKVDPQKNNFMSVWKPQKKHLKQFPIEAWETQISALFTKKLRYFLGDLPTFQNSQKNTNIWIQYNAQKSSSVSACTIV